MISSIDKARSYLDSGRSDIAEIELRKIIKNNSENFELYNDLGVSLLNQKKLSQAIFYFDKALSIKPNNFVSRDNLAKALYQNTEYEAALGEYEEILDRFYRLNEQTKILKTESSLDGFTKSNIILIHKNISSVYLAMGNYDEARCHLNLALKYASYIEGKPYFNELQLAYIRLLMSIHQYKESSSVAKLASESLQSPENKYYVFDYALNSYATKDSANSKKMFMEVIDNNLLSSNFILTSQLLLYRLLTEDNNGNQSQKDNASNILKEQIVSNSKYCSSSKIYTESFWPYKVINDLSEIREELCSNNS